MDKENRFAGVSLDGATSTAKETVEREVVSETLSSLRPRASTSSGISGTIYRSMERNPTSVVLSGTIDAIKEIEDFKVEDGLKGLLNTRELSFILLDATKQGTEISAILVCRQAENRVAVVNLGIAATTGDLGDTYVSDEDRRRYGAVSVPRVPSDIYRDSEAYRNTIYDLVGDAYPGLEICLAGQIIIERGIDLTSSDAIRPSIYRAIETAEGYLADKGSLDAGTYCVADLAQNTRMVVKTTFNNGDIADGLGNLIRSDARVSLYTRSTIERGQERSSKTINQTVADMYVDFVLAGQDVDYAKSQNWTPDNTQTFVPTLVLTNLDSETNAVTLPQLLLSIFSTNFLVDKNRWVAACRPMFAKTYQTKFIGGLGRFIPEIGTPIDRNGNFKQLGVLPNDASFAESYREFIEDGVYLNDTNVAIDITDAGPLAPIHSIILDAALGVAESVDYVVGALDELTDGAFSNLWNNASRPRLFSTDDSYIPLGRFTEADGTKRSLHNIDNLYLMMTIDDVKAIEDFNDAIYDVDFGTSRQRLNTVLSVLRNMNQTIDVTGYARRVYITEAFFEILADAIEDCGVHFDTDGQIDIGSTQRRNGRHIRDRGVRGQSDVFRNRSVSRSSDRDYRRSGQRY